MIPIFSRFMHGLLTDYPYVLIVGLIGPALVGATGAPLTVFHIAALAILVMTLLTRAEGGLVRITPYKLHLRRRARRDRVAILSVDARIRERTRA